MLLLLALPALPTLALAGCDASVGSSEQVRLVVTPVPSPTVTPEALPTTQPVSYTVRAGDTLSGIAAMFGLTVDDLVRHNNITDPNTLAEGQVLTIPGRPATPTPTPEGTPSPRTTGTPGTPGAPAASATAVLPPPDVTPPQGPAPGPVTP
ncbi:MAG TPA: LysM peptidoglycan-binding domain-containing protein [Chloroflexia bacterium]|nr:LysM peptidoglycan-binding domain-containing protein [Chloroflexia bacterium]